MENSSRFFANKECEYYPCHEMEGDINCMFCYCPLYNMQCPGNYKMKGEGERQIKSCIDCTFPHEPENFEQVIAILRSGIGEGK